MACRGDEEGMDRTIRGGNGDNTTGLCIRTMDHRRTGHNNRHTMSRSTTDHTISNNLRRYFHNTKGHSPICISRDCNPMNTRLSRTSKGCGCHKG